MLSFVKIRHEPSPRVLARDEADLIAAEIDRAIADAISNGGLAVIRFDVANRRWAAWATAADDSTWTPPSEGHWNDLGPKLIYGSGNATTGPLGEPIDPLNPAPLQTVVCDAWGRCELAGGLTLSTFIAGSVDGDAVAAVTLTYSGSAESWVYESSNGTWE